MKLSTLLEASSDGPYKAKLIYVPLSYSGSSSQEIKANKKKFDDLWKEAHDIDRKLGHQGGAAGWFVRNAGDSLSTALGTFLDGPFKGSTFSIHVLVGKDYKVGEEVQVTADSTYGRVKLVK